jgi:hypothetical protein
MAGSNPTVVMSVVSVVCGQVEVSVSGPSLVQRCPTESSVSEYDREASIMRSPWPTKGCYTISTSILFEGFVGQIRVFRVFNLPYILDERIVIVDYLFRYVIMYVIGFLYGELICV